jgi:hypothetical protein
MPITLGELDAALAKLALWMRAQGTHGLAALPIFERLEREREVLASLDVRLDLAIARGDQLKSKKGNIDV